MNFTRDFHEYVNIVKNTYVSKFHFKCEKYNPLDKCTMILRQMIEVEKNIDSLKTVSKKSSPFNDTHLKLGNVTSNIKNTLNDLEKATENVKKDLNELRCTTHERNTILNSIDLLSSKLKNLSLKFNKFLQSQSEIIKAVEQRRSNLSSSGLNQRKQNKNHNVYTSLPSNDHEDFLELDNEQTMMQTNQNKNVYYQERSNAVQYVERMMNDLATMFSRISQIAYEQRSMIEKIDNNTDVALHNIEAGLGEIKKMDKDVRSNRGLLIKIFLILIVTAVLYILFFA